MYDILKIEELEQKYELVEDKKITVDEEIKELEKKLLEDIKKGVKKGIYLEHLENLKEKYKVLKVKKKNKTKSAATEVEENEEDKKITVEEEIKELEKKLLEDIKKGVKEGIYLEHLKNLKEKYKVLKAKEKKKTKSAATEAEENEEVRNNLLEDIKNNIINGDNVKLMQNLPKECIDLVVTSPPYDDLRDYENGIVWNFEVFKRVATELYRIMKPGAVVVWVVGDKTKDGNKSLTSFKQAIYFQELGFKIYDVIIYEKSGTAPPHPNRYFNAFEYMFILSKGKDKIKTVNLIKDKENKWGGYETYGEVTRREKDGTLTNKGKKVVNEYGIRTNIWRYANGKGFAAKEKVAHDHPAIFPEKLAEDHIISWSNEGDLILDPFGGSGTTIKAAKKLNRNWIYIDKVEKYCQVASDRMEEAFGEIDNQIAMDL